MIKKWKDISKSMQDWLLEWRSGDRKLRRGDKLVLLEQLYPETESKIDKFFDDLLETKTVPLELDMRLRHREEQAKKEAESRPKWPDVVLPPITEQGLDHAGARAALQNHYDVLWGDYLGSTLDGPLWQASYPAPEPPRSESKWPCGYNPKGLPALNPGDVYMTRVQLRDALANCTPDDLEAALSCAEQGMPTWTPKSWVYLIEGWGTMELQGKVFKRGRILMRGVAYFDIDMHSHPRVIDGTAAIPIPLGCKTAADFARFGIVQVGH